MKDFSVIVAMDLNGIIGNSKTNDIPWHLPGDLKHFKEKTLGKTIVMGSRTWDSLPFRPLKGRRNVVISRRRGFIGGVDAQYSSLEDALEKEDDVIVIGGGQIYEECFQFKPKTVHITIVATESNGDVEFPGYGIKFLNNDFFVLHGTYEKVSIVRMQENNLTYFICEFVRV